MSKIRKFAVGLCLSVAAVSEAQAADSVLRLTPSSEMGFLAEIAPVGEPQVAEGRFQPPLDKPSLLSAATGRRGPSHLFFTQAFSVRIRTGILAVALPAPPSSEAPSLPAGTRFYHAIGASPSRSAGAVETWCTAQIKTRVCLINSNGQWIWREPAHKGEILKSFGRLLILQPDKMGPPDVEYPIAAPQISEQVLAPQTEVAQISVTRWENPGRPTSYKVVASCPVQLPYGRGEPYQLQCYSSWISQTDTLVNGDRIFVGGEGAGARLHFNADDGTFTVTRVALEGQTR